MGNDDPCLCTYCPKTKKKKNPSCGAYAPFVEFLAFLGALLRDLDDRVEALLAAFVPVVPVLLADPFSCATPSLESEVENVGLAFTLATAFGAAALVPALIKLPSAS
jgi:hypothetical protein